MEGAGSSIPTSGEAAFRFFDCPKAYSDLTLECVRKLVLGKGLRALLNGTRVPGGPAPASSASVDLARTGLGPGLGTLLRGEQKSGLQPESDSTSPVSSLNSLRRKWTLVKGILLAADLLLLSLASVLVFKSSGPLSILEWLLCILSLVLGAALAVLALLGNLRSDRETDGR